MATDAGAGELRAVALFEASKGVLALLAGSGLLLFWNTDAQAGVDALARHLYLNPARLHGGVLGEALESAGAHLRWIALGSLAYASGRFTEAYGLWRKRTWAEWFGVVSGLVYVPFDIAAIVRRPGLPSFAMLALNLLIVGVLARRLALNRRSEPSRAPGRAR